MRNGLAGLVALLELAALEHLRDVVLRGEPHPAEAAKRFQPFAVEPHVGLVRIEDLEDLCLVRLRVLLDLFRRQRRACFRSAGWIANQRGEGADHVDDRVAEVLEVLHLADEHRVAKVEVRRGGVEADLDDKRPSRRRGTLQFQLEVAGADNVHTALGQIRELLVDGHRKWK